MRTLQEKYNAIQQGKFSKDHFLAEARMQQPQLVTRFNGYDDAVQILKNRGMIKEGIDFSNHSDDAITDMIVNLSRYEGNEQEIKIAKDELARRKETLQEARITEVKDLYSYKVGDQVKFTNGEIWKVAKPGVKGSKVFLAPFNDIAKKGHISLAIEFSADELKDTVNEARLTSKSLTDYRYKPTNDMDKYPYEQILRGLRVELEGLGVNGTPTAEQYAKALAKVSKNLEKDSIFYTNQVAGVNPKVDLHDKMVTATAKNTVDTFNGMKKAELKEGFKKLIKKVLSENMGDMFGDEEREERRSNYGQPGERDYSNAENYKDEEEEFELQQEEAVTESGMGDVYQLAKESDTFEDFVQAIEQEYGPTSDVDELMYIWDNRQGGDIDYDDENFSDPFIDGDDLFEAPEPFLNLKQLHTLAQRAGNFGEDVKEALLSLYNAYEEKTPVSKVKEILANYDLTLRDLKSQPATFSPSREFAHLFNSSEREDSLYEERKSLSQLLK